MNPLELLLTTAPRPAARLTAFEAACQHLLSKPLLVELARGASAKQPMLGKVIR